MNQQRRKQSAVGWRIVLILAYVLSPYWRRVEAHSSLRRTRKIKGEGLLSISQQPHRRLPKRPSSHGGGSQASEYLGCLGLSSAELKYSWIFSSEAPPCQYTHHPNCDYSSWSSVNHCSNYENKGYDSSSSYSGDSASTSYSASEYSANQGDSASSSGSNNGYTGTTDGARSSGSGNSNQNQGTGNTSQYTQESSNADSSGQGNYSSSRNRNHSNSSNNNHQSGSNKQNSSYKQSGNNYKNQNNAGYGDQVVTNQDFTNSSNGYGDNSMNTTYNGPFNNQSYDPYSDFNIKRCDTYQNLWLWDLSLTCGGDGNLSTCQCQFAEQLKEAGRISCGDVVRCPAECPICTTCFRLINCTNAADRNVHGAQASSHAVFVLGGTAGLFMLYYFYYANNQRKGSSGMDTCLIEGGPEVMASASEDDAISEPRVWLAPVVSAAQFELQQHPVALEEMSDVSIETFSTGSDPIAVSAMSPAAVELPPEHPDDNVWLAPMR